MDVPADPMTLSGLFVQKVAAKSVAQVGDFVDYTVTVKNNTGTALSNVTVTDNFPNGFGYVKNTLRLDGVATTEPVIASGTAQITIGSVP